MLRTSLFTASALALVAGASAQTPQQVSAEKVPGTIKHAGIYHVSTGTWTRTGGAVANFGPDVIYSNTAGSGYFTTDGGAGGFAPGSTNFDEGGLPGTTNASTVWGGPGPNRDEYNANGFEVGYCDLGAAGSGGWEISFYSEYTPCTAATNPDAVIQVTGLPAGGCWTVVMDLMGGAEFCLQSDGGAAAPGWDNDAALDSFGWSHRYIGTDGTQPAGFLLNGDPTYTDPTFLAGGMPLDGTGTYYGATSLCVGPGGVPENGTGYLTRDFWWLEDPAGTSSNCYFFGGYVNRFNGCGGPSGNPYASFHMQIWADTGACGTGSTAFGTIYCTSNANSTGVTTAIEMTGSEVGTDDDVLMRAFNMPMNSFGFFITSQTQGFVANPAGSQGNICVAGNIGRFVAPGQVKSSGAAGEISLDTNLGEWSTQLIPVANGAPYAALTGVTSSFQLWHRDIGSNSNFSDAVQVDWL